MPKEIVINSYNPHKVVEAIANFYKTKHIETGGESRVIIPKTYGEGYIGGIDFKDGLGMLIFNCMLNQDTILNYRSDNFQPLRFIFCLESYFTHVIKADRLQYQLNHLSASIVTGTCKNEQLFILPAGKRIYYYSIEIDRALYKQKFGHPVIDQLPPELKEVFMDAECKLAFLYQGHFSLAIAEAIQNIKLNKFEGLVGRIFLESQTLEILAMQIRQYLDDMVPGNRHSSLRKRDVVLIAEAYRCLLLDISKPPTIKELSRLVGTNENKLKIGFKKLYKSSINKIIQDERLNKSRLLIAEGISVKDVAKAVGYSHAGHFTSKFKARFGVLPKDYLKSINGG